MRLFRKTMSVVLAAALALSGLTVTEKASAQAYYETARVYISTDLVPEDDNISVEMDGTRPLISSAKNVQFDLDCNVDCTWTVTPETGGAATNKVTIDSMGHVKITKDATDGSYKIEATAKNIKTTSNTLKADCLLTVRGNEVLAKSTKVILDKEKIESQRSNVSVSEEGTKLTVNGKVQGLKLYTKVEPSYLLEDYVNFGTDSENSVGLDQDRNDGYHRSLFSSKAVTQKGNILAMVGEERGSHEFDVVINKCEYKANVDCDNIPAKDKESSTKFNIRLNEDLDFYIKDNASETLPEVTTGNVGWVVKNKSQNTNITANAAGNYVTDLGTFTVSSDGKSINLKTPTKNSPEYDAYKSAIEKGNNQIVFEGTVPFSYKGSESSSEEKSTVPSVTFEFSDTVNAITEVGLDFSSNLEEGRDYVVKKEMLGGKETDVYYFEADGKKLDLVRATQGNITGVRDFEEARKSRFDSDNVNYTTTYTLADVSDPSFGTNDTAIKEYQNSELGGINDLGIKETNTRGEVITNDRSLTKKGIGYKKLTVSAKGIGATSYTENSYILRFVSDASNMRLVHNNYKIQEHEYWNNAVIHVRQGEADLPSVQLGYSLDADPAVVTIYNPFIEYTFSKIKGKEPAEEIASAFTDSNGKLQISGLTEGKVLVTAKSVVDHTKMDTYVLYVNDDMMVADEIQIDLTSAVRMGAMDYSGNVEGAVKDIPLGIRAIGNNAGIPKVTWSSSDDSYASISEDGLLTTKKTTGSDSVTITATSVADPTKTAELTLHIKDIPATGVKRISEKVSGQTPVLTQGNDNSASCKANEQLTLQAVEFVPSNASSMNGKIEWSSANEEIAAVKTMEDGTGVVQTLKEGEVVITLSYTSAQTGKSDTTFTLKVAGYANKVTSIECKSEITFSRVGLTEKLEPAVLPASVSDKSVTYESKDVKVATVTQDGVVTATGNGTTEIVIKSTLNPEVTKTVTVTVEGDSDPIPSQPASAEPISSEKPDASADPEITPDPASSEKPDASADPEITPDPASSEKPDASADPEITPDPASSEKPGASADPGTTPDPANPAASQKPGASAAPGITPNPSNGTNGQNTNTVTDLVVRPVDAIIAIGGSVLVQADKVPLTANGVVMYTSSDSMVAAVDSSGKVIGIKAGSAVITVSCGTVSKSVIIRVAKNPNIKLAKNSIKRKQSTSIKIANKAKGAKVTYKITKGKSITLSKKGKITGKKKGKTVITVKVTQYGKTYKKNLTVTVK